MIIQLESFAHDPLPLPAPGLSSDAPAAPTGNNAGSGAWGPTFSTRVLGQLESKACTDCASDAVVGLNSPADTKADVDAGDTERQAKARHFIATSQPLPSPVSKAADPVDSVLTASETAPTPGTKDMRT